MTLLDDILAAREIERRGEIAEAERRYHVILAAHREQPDALYRLALITSDKERYEDAIALLNRAIAAVTPRVPDVYFFNLGRIRNLKGDYEQAVAAYGDVIRVNPEYIEAYVNRGVVLRELGRNIEALECYRQALALKPDFAEAYFSLGNSLRELGRFKEACEAFEKAIAFANPADTAFTAMAYNNMGVALNDLSHFGAAAANLQRAAELAPTDASYACNYANALRNLSLQAECLTYYDRAITLDPLYVEPRWARITAQIPLLYETPEEMPRARQAFLAQIDATEQWFANGHMDLGHMAVGTGQPFFIAYQEVNNREPLGRYGALCAKLMAAWAEQQKLKLPEARAKTARRGAKPLRVGIFSSHFYDHSVWRALIKGWLRFFDPRKIEIHVMSCSTHRDGETEWARAHAASFSEIRPDLDATVGLFLDKAFDVLIYPDIGMDPFAVKLASLRLSPVQIASWGHPETSGLPTIDYYLSAEAFEPPQAQDGYVEKLIALPNLGCCYHPVPQAATKPDLAALGIRPNVPLLIAPGMSFKYKPQHDQVFVDIARQLGACQIVFFHTHEILSNRLQERLRNAFAKAGLDFDAFCLFAPVQSQSVFLGMYEVADVALDTIGFSGFNTAIQAIECGLPMVMFEGDFMRGRLGSGLMRRMGIDELVATDDASFARTAVRLATDKAFRAEMQEQIVAKRAILFDDRAPVDALQDFLLNNA